MPLVFKCYMSCCRIMINGHHFTDNAIYHIYDMFSYLLTLSILLIEPRMRGSDTASRPPQSLWSPRRSTAASSWVICPVWNSQKHHAHCHNWRDENWIYHVNKGHVPINFYQAKMNRSRQHAFVYIIGYIQMTTIDYISFSMDMIFIASFLTTVFAMINIT